MYRRHLPSMRKYDFHQRSCCWPGVEVSDDGFRVTGEASIVKLARITEIATYEVQEMELERLDSLVAAENQALAFTTFTGGICVATFLGWLAASSLSPTAKAIYAAAIGCSFVASCWFGTTWHRARRERPKLLMVIKARATALTSYGESPIW
jgi:hypothetical protein